MLPFFSFKSFANKKEGKITADLSTIKKYFDHVIIKMTGFAEFGDSVITIDTIQAIEGKFEYSFSVPGTRMTVITLLKNNQILTDLAVKDAALSKESGFFLGFCVGNENIKINYYSSEWRGQIDVKAYAEGMKENKWYWWFEPNALDYEKITKKYAKKYPDSYSVLQAIYLRKEVLETDEISDMIEPFSDELKHSGTYAAITKYLSKMAALEKGEFATDFNWFDINGVPHDFETVLNGKKYVLIVFWSGEDELCRYQIKFSKEIEQQYADKVSIVYLSVDDDFEKWKKVSEEEKITWFNLSGLPDNKRRVKDVYYIDYVPEFILLDANGKSLIKRVTDGVSEIQDLLKTLE